ncbi:MAG: O-antigen ligase family protein [Vicinamibacterales bacterium]
MIGYVLSYVITALASIAALRRPLIGLYAYVGFAILRPQFIFRFAGDMSSLSLVLGVALLAGWAMNGFGNWDLGRSKPVVIALFGYTFCYMVSASLAEFTDVSWKAVLELLKIVLPFCVGLTMIREEKDWKPLLWVIVLSQGYVGFEQNLNYLKGYNTAAEGFGGMDNNCFGVSLVTVLGPAIGLVLISQKWWERAAAGVATAFILHTTLLTFSRGAMVGMVVVGLSAFIALPKRPKYIVWMLVAALVAARLTGPQLLARYSTVLASSDERDGSAQSRLDLWQDTLKVIAAQPVFGVGPANWRMISSRFGWTEGKSAHSVWMETGAEVGVPGTLSLLMFFVIAALRLWPLARAKVTPENYYRVGAAIGVVLGVIGFVTSGQFVSVVGLEAPYYVVLVGVVVMRTSEHLAVHAPVAVPVRPGPIQAGVPSRPRTSAAMPTQRRPQTPAPTRLIPLVGPPPRREA